jgi:predicted DNA-binding transcriptional regulator AlpA
MKPNTPQNPAPTLYGGLPNVFSDRVPSTPSHTDRIIRLAMVCELTALGKSSVYSIPDFPKRFVLSRRAVGWKLSEVQAWIESRVTAGGKS